MQKFILIKEDGEIITRYIEGLHKIIPETAIKISDEIFDQSMEHTHYIDGVLSTIVREATTEELRQKFKRDRQKAVDELTVTLDNMIFDADEESQGRMSRAIVALEPLETQLWVLNDNTIAYPTREQLKAVLRLAGTAQTNIWVTE